MKEPMLMSIFNCTPDSKLYDHKLSLDKMRDALANFGLTPNQTRVYIYLGKYGSKTAPEVCKALEMPRTETYHILNSLQNIGIVSMVCQHPTMFSALPLDKAISILVNTEKVRLNDLQNKEEYLMGLWNQIPTFMVETNETEDIRFQMLQGENQINGRIKQMLSDVKNNILICGSEKDLGRFYHSDLISLCNELSCDFRILIPSTDRIEHVFKDIDKTKIATNKDISNKGLCFIVKDDDEVIFFMRNADHPAHHISAIWTDSTLMNYSMKRLFEYEWSSADIVHEK